MEAREYIKALVAHGLTQVQIAEKTGIPQPTISKVARGEVDDVLSRNYRKLQTLHTEVIGLHLAPDTPAPIEQAQQGGEVAHG